MMNRRQFMSFSAGLAIASTFASSGHSQSQDDGEAWIPILDPRIESEKFGYINRKGCWVTDPIFDEAYPFSDGLAKVRMGGKFGFIDRRGRIVIPARFQKAFAFSDGMAAASAGPDRPNDGGFIDRNGDVIIPRDRLVAALSQRSIDPKYFYFRDGLLALNGNSKKCVALNKEGRIVFEINNASFVTHGFDDPHMPGDLGSERETSEFMGFADGLAAIRLEDAKNRSAQNDRQKEIYVDKSGRPAFRQEFFSAGFFSEGLAPVLTDDPQPVSVPLKKYINTKGELQFSRRFYIFGQNFRESLAGVVLGDETYGYIGKDGRVRFEIQANYGMPFSGGLAAFSWNERWGFVDTNGAVVIEPKYEHIFQIGTYSRSFLPNEKTIWTINGNKTAVIDTTGSEIFSFTMNQSGSPRILVSPLDRCR